MAAIFVYMMSWQWLQVTIKVFYANLIGLNITEISDSGSPEKAILLSLAGLVIIALGINVVLNNSQSIDVAQLKATAERFSVKQLFKLYILFALLNLFIQSNMFSYPSITQVLVGLLNIKIIIISLLFMVTLMTRQTKKWMVIVIVVEVVMGFTQYFSGFKEVLIYLLIAALTVNYKINTKYAVRYAFVLLIVLIMGLGWMSIRERYRDFLSGGLQQQVIVVTYKQRFNKLIDLTSNIDANDLTKGLDVMITRTSYTDIFGQVLDRVPAYTPYEDGYILYNSFLHVLMPRFIFPTKKVIYDSEKTNYYTGKNYMTDLQGTSIGLGYMAEFYIDFGYFMFIPLFFLGLFYGYVYKFIVKNIKPGLIAYSMIIPLFMGVALFETTHNKLIGGLLSSFLVLYIVNKFLKNIFISYIRK